MTQRKAPAKEAKPAQGRADKPPAPAKKRSRVDWDAIEPHYRAGIRALKDIGREFDVSDAAIIKHARLHDWARSPKPTRTVVLRAEVDEFARSGFVYVIFVESGPERFYKIGMAAHFDSRLKGHQCSSPFDVKVACCYFVGNMRAEEATLHALFATQRVRGEWFRLTPADLSTISGRALLV